MESKTGNCHVRTPRVGGLASVGKLFHVPIKFCDAILLLSGPRLPMAERIVES